MKDAARLSQDYSDLKVKYDALKRVYSQVIVENIKLKNEVDYRMGINKKLRVENTQLRNDLSIAEQSIITPNHNQ